MVGKLLILQSFIQIRDDRLKVEASSEIDVFVDGSIIFLSKVKKYKNMMTQIEVITKLLQTSGHKLSQCRNALDVLIEAVSLSEMKFSRLSTDVSWVITTFQPTLPLLLFPIWRLLSSKLSKSKTTRSVMKKRKLLQF